MLVMPSNNTGIVVGYLAGRHPGKIGHLFSPDGLRRTHDWMPFALDNGKFACWDSGKVWDEAAYRGMLSEVAGRTQQPLWALIPDQVADAAETLRLWSVWLPVIQNYGWSPAFAVQDGMTKADVPSDAEVIFVGGSTKWKWSSIYTWCDNFDRVHVGRVNSPAKLWLCDGLGVESCDGTGWFRGNETQTNGLVNYLELSARGERPRQEVGLWT